MNIIFVIQRNFRSKKILNQIKNLNLHKLLGIDDFDELSKCLCDKKLVNNVKELLNYLITHFDKYSLISLQKNNITVLTRIFITNIIIYKFHDIVLSHKTEYNDFLIKMSNNIINTLKLMCNSNNNKIIYTIKLINYFCIFLKKYNIWARLDKRLHTYDLLLSFHKNINLSKKLNVDKAFHIVLINKIKEDQKSIINNVIYLNDTVEQNEFIKYKDNLDYSNTIHIELYWIDVKYRLSKKGKDIEIVLELLSKTKFLLCRCVPKRIDIHNDIEKYIDLELLKQYLDNEIYDNNYFFNIITFVLNKIKEFQARIDDDNFEVFKNIVFNKLKANIYYKDFLPYFFRNIFNRLEKIIKDKDIFMSQFNEKK